MTCLLGSMGVVLMVLMSIAQWIVELFSIGGGDSIERQIPDAVMLFGDGEWLKV
eukprot:CAMPEP_0196808994 /NCGR_PEP_ID=MMETSP1362-20130617/8967_1 /TAXON_ID=163516 /ORGANISM="Leptocylindrus danicus, Strain CCMP1856" /LENGTH=53 /DNA_ID=CAMNT_0042183525 /DNA_START=417 /DNA_END=579 /DNA_ORIENTATION=-